MTHDKLIEDAARAMESRLFSDDPAIRRQAASPLMVEHAQKPIIDKAVAALAPTLALLDRYREALEEIERGEIVKFTPSSIEFNERSPIQIARAALTPQEPNP